MNKAAIYHRAMDSWCYPIDESTLHIRLQTASGDVDRVELQIGDPFEWSPAAKESGKPSHWLAKTLEMEKIGGDGIHDFWGIRHELPYKRSKYRFFIHGGDGEIWTYGERGLCPQTLQDTQEPQDLWNSFIFPYINHSDIYQAPAWVSETVWYEIFPERFRNGNPLIDPPGSKAWSYGAVTNQERYGGDLTGIREKLDYLAALGINGLYLTPIFAAPSVHKYDTEDYCRVDPHFGTEEDLHRLIDECHARGIRIMLDAVFNHAGKSFKPWLDVVERGRDSRYADWFCIKSWPLFPTGRDTGNSHDAGFETFAFTTHMPKLNTANPEVRDYLLGIGERYVRDFGIDAWRLDVANEIDRDFWRIFRTRMKAIKPDLYILGEIWHDPMPWLRGDQFDAVMNYPYGMAIIDFVLGRHGMDTARDFQRTLDSIDFSYPEPALRHSFMLLESHDTERLIHGMHGDKALSRLAWLLLFLLPGSPCIYYGSEYGLTGAGDPDNRRCMPWDEEYQDLEQQDFMKRLISLRRRHWPIFQSGRKEFHQDQKDPGLFAIIQNERKMSCLTLINRSDTMTSAASLLAGLGGDFRQEWKEILTDPREKELAGALEYSDRPLLPHGFRLFMRTACPDGDYA